MYYCGETDRLPKLTSDCQDKKFQKALKTDGEMVARYVSSVGLKEFAAALPANVIYQNAAWIQLAKNSFLTMNKVIYMEKPTQRKKQSREILGLNCNALVDLRRAAIGSYLELDLDNEGGMLRSKLSLSAI